MRLKLIWYDIKNGMMYNGIKLLLPWIFGTAVVLIFIAHYKSVYGSSDGATFLEGAMYLYKGARYIPPEQIETDYRMPALWLMIQIITGYLVGSYSTEDIHTYGQQVLIRSGSRTSWWVSKCIWNVITVIYNYMSINFAMLVTCMVCGADMSLSYKEGVFTGYVLEMMPCTGTMKELLLFVFVMPIIVAIAASVLQMFLALIFSPIIGFITIQIMAILSTMVVHPVFFHNFSALARSNIASPTDVSIEKGIAISVLVVAVSVVGGKIYFDRYSVLSKE